ncbi:hypothetical protein GCM10018793_30430 [Streptomyces sulfonofaciens]|uniref:Uncharacterized protein n=1 Tax=Streptomyces sulfonofaciens TaxID=68272 RepID=A0A919G693_9ACTN|nr:hypothetical protein [Streptomyces sulfonofaciens]GHH78863.1 hypothetical protein GCM10018793_30430 [Streptomyces sulfonofaciens]
MPEQTAGSRGAKAGGSAPGGSSGSGGSGADGGSGAAGGGAGAAGGGAAPGSGGPPHGGPDFFDRLLARHVPSARAADGVVRVRPRLPGPFERIDALPGGADDVGGDEGAGAPWPAAHESGTRPGEPGRALREIRTEHERTVLSTPPRSEHEAHADRGTRRPAAAPALLRPAASPTPHGGWPAEPGRPGDGRDGGASDAGAGPAAAAPRPGAVLPPTSASWPPRPAPAADAAPTARGTARAAGARRGPRGGERVVHVQIGRLEVSAGGTAPDTGRAAAAPVRRGPVLSLEDYLTGRGRGDGAPR